MKHFELFFGVVYAEIMADGELVYKIKLENNGLILTDANNVYLAEIEVNYFPFLRKNVIRAHFLKDDRTITVDKNFLGSKYYINFDEDKQLEINYRWASGLYILNQPIRVSRIGGSFTKFTQKLNLKFEDTRTAQMIFITLFVILRKVTDR